MFIDEKLRISESNRPSGIDAPMNYQDQIRFAPGGNYQNWQDLIADPVRQENLTESRFNQLYDMGAYDDTSGAHMRLKGQPFFNEGWNLGDAFDTGTTLGGYQKFPGGDQWRNKDKYLRSDDYLSTLEPSEAGVGYDRRGFNLPSIFGAVKGGLESIKDQFEYKPATEEAWDPNTGQFVSAEEQDKMNALGGYYSDAARNARRKRARVINMIKRRDAKQEFNEERLNEFIRLGYGPEETITTTTVGDNINQGGGGGSEAAFTQTSPGGISQEVSRAARGGQGPRGAGAMSGWGLAEGGRIGYQEGEFVDEDINIEGPGFDVNENLMASDPSAMDSLNEMSLQIFGKGLHELSEEEYQMLIDMTNEQASAGQDQGLASLV